MAFAKYGLDEIAKQFPKTFAKQKAISGGDALMGHTRSHPEHDG